MISGDIFLYLHGQSQWMEALGLPVPPFSESGNLHSALRRILFTAAARQTLLFAKFIPGINTMSPPLAGSLKMRLGNFLLFDSMGALFYVGAYSIAGYLFSDGLRAITRGLRSAGFAAEVISGLGLIVYVVYRVWIYRKYRLLDVIPRVEAEDLAKSWASDAGSKYAGCRRSQPRLLRSDSERIAGSIRIEPNNLIEEVKIFPRIGRFIFTALDSAKPPAPVWRVSYRIRI